MSDPASPLSKYDLRDEMIVAYLDALMEGRSNIEALVYMRTVGSILTRKLDAIKGACS